MLYYFIKALKILRIQGSSDKIKSLCIERWAKEVEIMQRLSHPNVVKTIALPSELLCLSPEYPILCMEYCEKGDLRKVKNICTEKYKSNNERFFFSTIACHGLLNSLYISHKLQYKENYYNHCCCLLEIHGII